jgi:hypothetical protein
MHPLAIRYVTAATQHLPESRRSDVAREIRTAIDELVDQRRESGEPEDLAVRESLNELGDPAKFAAAYEDAPRYLIGPGWYPSYIALLKRLLPIGLIGFATIVMLLDMSENPGGDRGFTYFVSHAVNAMYNIGVQILLWVTAGFIIAERAIGPAGPTTGRTWTVNDLPELPVQRRIGLNDTLPEIGVLLLTGVLVVVQHVRGFGVKFDTEATKDMPLLNPDLVPGWATAFFILLGISIIASLARYRQGTWTRTIFLFSVIDDVLWIAFIVILALSKPIFNTELMQHTDAFDNIWAAGDSANLTVAAIVTAISAWSIWEAWLGYRQQNRTTT